MKEYTEYTDKNRWCCTVSWNIEIKIVIFSRLIGMLYSADINTRCKYFVFFIVLNRITSLTLIFVPLKSSTDWRRISTKSSNMNW